MSTKSLQNGAKRHQIVAERSKTTQINAERSKKKNKLMQNAAKRHQIKEEPTNTTTHTHRKKNTQTTFRKTPKKLQKS